MTELRANGHHISSASSAYAAADAEFGRRLAHCEKSIQQMLGAGWQGAGASAFSGDFADWAAGARRVQTALGGISKLLAHARTKYDEAESELTRATQDSQGNRHGTQE